MTTSYYLLTLFSINTNSGIKYFMNIKNITLYRFYLLYRLYRTAIFLTLQQTLNLHSFLWNPPQYHSSSFIVKTSIKSSNLSVSFSIPTTCIIIIFLASTEHPFLVNSEGSYYFPDIVFSYYLIHSCILCIHLSTFSLITPSTSIPS